MTIEDYHSQQANMLGLFNTPAQLAQAQQNAICYQCEMIYWLGRSLIILHRAVSSAQGA